MVVGRGILKMEKNDNKEQTPEEMKDRMLQLKPILATFQWDISRNQLNPGKKRYYDNLKSEYDKLLQVLDNENNNKAN